MPLPKPLPPWCPAKANEKVHTGTHESWGKRGPGWLPSETASQVGRGDSCCACLAFKLSKAQWGYRRRLHSEFKEQVQAILAQGGVHAASVGRAWTSASLSDRMPRSQGETAASGWHAVSLTCTLQSWYRLDVPTQVLFPVPGTDFLLVGKCGTVLGLD